MSDVSIRDLRNRGGDIVDRAAAGEAITITRAGEAVAELRPLGVRPITAQRLIERWRSLPPVDERALRSDVDSALDASI
jgi:prevent-host-death family protein